MSVGENTMLLLLPLILNSVSILAREPGLRIVGGRPAKITERPFQVLIYRKSPVPVAGCGGVIIHRRWILTAAHCTLQTSASSMTIRAGSDNLNDKKRVQWFNVVKVIPHKEFFDSQWTMANDIALLMVDREIKFGPNLRSIKVRSVSPEPKTEAVVSGFGVIKEGNVLMSGILREVSLWVIDKKTCKELLGQIPTFLSLKVSETHFCAADLKGGRDACQGDSGGPITINGSLAGVVSWGIGCGRRMVPAFFTDVAQFIPWINETLRKYSKRQNRAKRFLLPTIHEK